MYFGDHPVSENYQIHLEGQYRRQGLGQRWEQLLLRPGVTRKWGHGVSTMLAYTYLRDYPFEGGSLGDPNTTGPQPEHRILEELQIKRPLVGTGKQAVTLAHRFRLEQRFLGTSTAGLGTQYWQFAERARYRLTANVPIRAHTSGIRPDYVSLYNEFFVNFGPHGGDRAFDQNRTYGAVGWKLDRDFELEVGYMHQYLPVPNGVVGEHNHALQISINGSLPFFHGKRSSD